MHLQLLDLDDSLTAQSSLHDAAPWDSVRTLDLRDLGPRLRLWSRAKTIGLLRQRLSEAGDLPGPCITLMGSGDFHHLTTLLMARARQPFTLIHFDNHPVDLVRDGFDAALGEFVLPYDDVRRPSSPEEAAAAFFFTVPGPKMVWQFGELGYDISIVQNGRVGNKPILWNYYQNANRRKLYDVYRSLIALKKIEPVFENPTTYTQQLVGAAKSIHLANANTSVTVIGNFDVNITTIDPAFQATGKWYNYLSGDSITVSNVNAQISLQPGEYAVYTNRRIRRTVLATRAEQANVLRLSAAPNPAQGSTTLYYELPTGGPVQLTVRNVLGQSVLTLPATREAAGPHTRELPLGQLAAGVYIVQFRADTNQQILRLVVE